MFGSVGDYSPGAGLRPAMTSGRIAGGMLQGMRYPSPFFDIAHTYLPVTMKQLFRWCRYFYLLDPILHIGISRLSEYPVTDVIVDHESDAVTEKWSDYLQHHLRIRSFQIEMGLDYHTYGNGFATIVFPFIKYLKCTSCSHLFIARKIRSSWRFDNYQFRLTCPDCGVQSVAIPHDHYIKDATGVKLMRLNPEDIDIEVNEITGDRTYFFQIPASTRNDVLMGKKHIVETTPNIFIQAMRETKSIILNQENLFHMHRPTLANQDRGWGIPLILPVLKHAFQLQIMKKTQEQILLEHCAPLRILFPQSGAGSADPYTTINLQDWKAHVAMELARWRHDQNYIPVLPLPVGNQTIGGDGKALLMTADIRDGYEMLLAGIGLAREFVFGGLGYSASNTSARMQEQSFLGYISYHRTMLNWIIRTVGTAMSWPVVRARFKPFKMADDIQRQALNIQLNQNGKLSDTTLLAGLDYDQASENAIMVKETAARVAATKKQQIAQAELQGAQQLVMAKYQVKAQEVQAKAQSTGAAPGEPGGQDTMGAGTPGGQVAGQAPVEQAPGPTEAAPQQPPQPPAQDPSAGMEQPDQQALAATAYSHAQMLISLPKEQQQAQLQALSAQDPAMAEMVSQFLNMMGGPKQEQAPAVDMRPLPEAKPPRRMASPI